LIILLFFCDGMPRFQALTIGDNLRFKPTINVVFIRSLDAPKSPLRRGVGVDFDRIYCPPLLRGVRGDLDLDKNKRSGRLDVKLSPISRAG